MSQLSQPGAVQLSAPGNEAESREWTLPGISLIHSFSLPKSLRGLLQCAAGQLCALQGQAGRGQQAQPRRGGVGG